MSNARTAQELADELERRTKTTVVSDPGRCGNLAEVLLSAAAELRRLAALASQAEPTMFDAIAAGDGTLHGAIDYWQQRASEDREHAALYRWLRDNCATYTSPKAPIQLIVQQHAEVHRTHGAVGYRKGLDDAIRAAKEQADPCPGCRPGIVCRTPKCGRLPKRSEQEVANGK